MKAYQHEALADVINRKWKEIKLESVQHSLLFQKTAEERRVDMTRISFTWWVPLEIKCSHQQI